MDIILGYLGKGKWEQLWKNLSYLVGVRLEIRLSGVDRPPSTISPASEQGIFPFNPASCVVSCLFAQLVQGRSHDEVMADQDSNSL